MKLPSYFKDFLADIRLTKAQIEDLKKGHKTLRDRLEKDEELSKIILCTFLQGSYRRSTAIRPIGEIRSDVDVIVVTKLDMDEYTPSEALDLFIPFLEKYYKDKYRIQGRSLGISLSYVDLDIVVTAAPSESQVGIFESKAIISDFSIEDFNNINSGKNLSYSESVFLNESREFFSMKKEEPKWKMEPLYIPDREAEEWNPTHPLEQIRWTNEKNKNCNGHYVNVVKALKWWRKDKFPDAGQPKSYPLEHFIGDCCPNEIDSVADGVVLVLEKIIEYSDKPVLSDRGVPEHDVFARTSDEDFSEFYEQVKEAAVIARCALDAEDIQTSELKWRELFGKKFPNNQKKNSSGFSQRTEKSEEIPSGRFACR
ncbi:SMODS domain-containing nucleotidyltransferase [Acetobacterium carbinolicum]|uniref:SMODS domain-containing nucleotidyltransferase n=1 Tax=Acetobacterium carbinolicum TaxID=52690 RepID=UPI0039C92824